MVAIHSITTKNKEGTIIFDEFVDDVQPIKVLEQVWVTVTKVPRALRSFLPLWVVGSIIGSTQKVDMVHPRAMGQVRLLVVVFEEKFPKFADVCVDCNVYCLYFKPDEVTQHDDFYPEEDDLLGDEDGNDKEKDLDNPDHEMGEADPKKELGNPSTDRSQPPPRHPSNLNQKQASLFVEALDLACDKLFNEISIKVVLEPDDGTSRKIFTPLREEELASYNALVDSPVKIHPSSVFFLPSPETQTVDVSTNSFILQHNTNDVSRNQTCVGDSTSPSAPSLPPILTPEDAASPTTWGTPSARGDTPTPSADETPTADQQEVFEALLSPVKVAHAGSPTSTFAPLPTLSTTPPATAETVGAAAQPASTMARAPSPRLLGDPFLPHPSVETVGDTV
jgi:hypothetical protein